MTYTGYNHVPVFYLSQCYRPGFRTLARGLKRLACARCAAFSLRRIEKIKNTARQDASRPWPGRSAFSFLKPSVSRMFLLWPAWGLLLFCSFDFLVRRSIIFSRRGSCCHLGLVAFGFDRCRPPGKFVGCDFSIQWCPASSIKAFAGLLLNLNWLPGAKIPEGCYIRAH